MAFISKKGIYALAAMHTLTHAPNHRVMKVSEISALTKISAPYLEQLLSKLRSKGFVRSTRGAFGGYELTKSANDIVVKDIIMTVEGDLFKLDKESLGDSLILEYFWKDVEQKMLAIFELKLSELDHSYMPFHYSI